MDPDKLLLIPYLSQELNLVGCSNLPYRLTRKKKKNRIKKKIPVNSTQTDDDFSTDGEDENAPLQDTKVVFDTNEMMQTLISVCFDLVKQVKKFNCFQDDDNWDRDKILFDNRKLKGQLDSLQKQLDEKTNLLSIEKENSRQLKEKLNQLENRLKILDEEKRRVISKSKTNENLLVHDMKKKEDDLNQLHKILWKKFNMVDLRSAEKNFEVVQLDQPDFNRLWADVKFSNNAHKEQLLKMAVCKFQENNNILMEENITFKCLLMGIFEEINDVTSLIADTLTVELISIDEKDLSEIFHCAKGIKTSKYRDFMGRRLSILKDFMCAVKKSSFSIVDDEFVCWSDVIKTVKSVWEESSK